MTKPASSPQRQPATQDTRFHDLRGSGWTGPIDQDGYAVPDLDEWIDNQLHPGQ